jgi:hypothetical protein
MNTEAEVMRDIRQRIAAAPKEPPDLLGIVELDPRVHHMPSIDGEHCYSMFRATMVLDTQDMQLAEVAAKSLPVMSELAERLGVDDVRRIEAEVSDEARLVCVVKLTGWVERPTKEATK